MTSMARNGITNFRPVFSLLWVALVGHLIASGPPGG